MCTLHTAIHHFKFASHGPVVWCHSMGTWHECIIVHYFFSLILALQEHFLRIPRSRCEPLGTTAIFHCRVKGFVTAYWSTTGLLDCNFNYTSRYRPTLNITTSRLQVPATSTQYNGTRFHCCFTTDTEPRCSRPAAILFVAGKICMPS